MWAVVAVAALLFAQASDHVAEGMQALEEGRYEQAADSFRRVLEADPDDYGAHFHLALIDSILGNRDQAVAVVQRQVEHRPDRVLPPRRNAHNRSRMESTDASAHPSTWPAGARGGAA